MRVAYLASGAAGMYCGSCMRDNRLAATLIEQGRDVVLLPLYTPLRTDEEDVSQSPIYYGGINVFLEQKSSLFRRLPRRLTGWLDAPGLLRRALRFSGATSAADLGALTVSVLRGEYGAQRRELDKLLEGLKAIRPDVVNLPFLLFVGVARGIKNALGVPILCTLTGEDIFLDALPEPCRREAFELIREGASFVDGFVAVTEYYARHAASHFGLPAERVHVVPMGVRVEDFDGPERQIGSPFTIGYLGRICPAKGLMNLCRALVELRKSGRGVCVRSAGYLGESDRPYMEEIRRLVTTHGVTDGFEYLGELDRPGKVAFLRSIDAFSMPTVYHEAKGVSVIEALAAATPVVQPRHGSFPEIIESTGGGLLYDPGSPDGLAGALARLMDEPRLRGELGQAGRAGVRAGYTDKLMAEKTWALYESYRANRRT